MLCLSMGACLRRDGTLRLCADLRQLFSTTGLSFDTHLCSVSPQQQTSQGAHCRQTVSESERETAMEHLSLDLPVTATCVSASPLLRRRGSSLVGGQQEGRERERERDERHSVLQLTSTDSASLCAPPSLRLSLPCLPFNSFLNEATHESTLSVGAPLSDWLLVRSPATLDDDDEERRSLPGCRGTQQASTGNSDRV